MTNTTKATTIKIEKQGDESRPTRRRTVRKLVSFVALLALWSAAIAHVDRAQADALSSFDTELLDLINEHRVNKGLDPFVQYGPLSDAALNWSNTMLSRRNAVASSGCPSAQASQFLVHDSSTNIGRQGIPPGTTRTGENIAWACGVPGASFPVSWSYGAMPAKCRGAIDFTTALMQFCGWVDSAPHRVSLESASFTYIGLGSVTKWTGNQGEPLSTARFAAAPVVPSCDGFVVTINMNTNGGNGNGTSGNDVILGTPGDDVINGFGGNDRICAAAGRDIVRGGGGADRIFGGADIDRIYGDSGQDLIYGEGGSDRIYGGSSADTVWAGSGADRVWGGDGDDTLNGMGGQDTMWGQGGHDTLQGNFQSDWLYGGDGRDTIYGAGGKDKLFGGAGNDALFGGNNTDYLEGGAGVDTANGGRGKDNPLVTNRSGCIAQTKISC